MPTAATRTVTVTDPWSGATTAVTIHPCPECGTHECSPRCQTRRDRDANRPCRCGRRACGECMREAAQGNRPSLHTS